MRGGVSNAEITYVGKESKEQAVSREPYLGSDRFAIPKEITQ
jgi:hypothetical protein